MSGKKPNHRPGEECDSEALYALLRQRPLPEPPPWFAVRTLVRLRNDQAQDGFARLASILRFWRLSAGLAVATCAVGLGFMGLHLKASQEKERQTFAALDLVAQGETPFIDEDATWTDAF